MAGDGGRPAIDPTENVKALSEAASKRQDDLREAESKRIDQLRSAEVRRIDEQLRLRAEYDEKLRDAEAKRIDAIRAVDVNAVAVASERAADQATVLANQVAASAEALRTLVASTAATQAASQTQTASGLSARLTTLEQAGYQAAGRSTLADPAFAEMLNEIKALRTDRDLGGGKSAGLSQGWGILIGAAGFLMALIGIGTFVFVTVRK